MRIGSVIVGVAFALAQLQAQADEPSGVRTLSLADCLRMALEQGPDRALIAADLAAAKARLEEAEAGRFGSAEYTQLLGLINEASGDAVSSPNKQTDFFKGLGPFTYLALDVRIPLYTFGKLSAAIEAAEQGLRSESARGAAVRADTVVSTKRMYYGLLLSQQLMDVLTDMLDSLDEAIEKTRKRLDDGSHSVTELDVLRLQIGRSKFAAGVAEVKASIRLTKRALARAVGLGADEELEIADRRLRPVGFEPLDLEQYAESGPRKRPEWEQVLSGLEAREAQVKLEEASLYPSFFLATGVRYSVAPNRDDQENPFVYDPYNNLEPIGLLGMRWDLSIFSGLAKAAQARAERDRLLAERRRTESGLRLEVERSYVSVERARATIEAARAGRKAARGLLILTVANYDLGIGDAEDLFDAFGSYTETSTDYFRAVHDFNVAVAELSRSVGEELVNY